MVEQPRIPQVGTAFVLNDMINANLRSKRNPDHDKMIEESGIIQNSVRLVTAFREHKIPIVWIRVERRADYANAIFPLTNASLTGGYKRPPYSTWHV